FDWIVSPRLIATTRVTLQHTATERIQGEGAPTWTSLGVKTFQYTAGGGQDFLAGGTAGWNGNVGFTGLFTSGTANANGGLNMADFVLGLPATFRQGGSQINDQSIDAL